MRIDANLVRVGAMGDEPSSAAARPPVVPAADQMEVGPDPSLEHESAEAEGVVLGKMRPRLRGDVVEGIAGPEYEDGVAPTRCACIRRRDDAISRTTARDFGPQERLEEREMSRLGWTIEERTRVPPEEEPQRSYRLRQAVEQRAKRQRSGPGHPA